MKKTFWESFHLACQDSNETPTKSNEKSRVCGAKMTRHSAAVFAVRPIPFALTIFFCSATVRQIAGETENKPRLHFLDDKGWQAPSLPPSPTLLYNRSQHLNKKQKTKNKKRLWGKRQDVDAARSQRRRETHDTDACGLMTSCIIEQPKRHQRPSVALNWPVRRCRPAPCSIPLRIRISTRKTWEDLWIIDGHLAHAYVPVNVPFHDSYLLEVPGWMGANSHRSSALTRRFFASINYSPPLPSVCNPWLF